MTERQDSRRVTRLPDHQMLAFPSIFSIHAWFKRGFQSQMERKRKENSRSFVRSKCRSFDRINQRMEIRGNDSQSHFSLSVNILNLSPHVLHLSLTSFSCVACLISRIQGSITRKHTKFLSQVSLIWLWSRFWIRCENEKRRRGTERKFNPLWFPDTFSLFEFYSFPLAYIILKQSYFFLSFFRHKPIRMIYRRQGKCVTWDGMNKGIEKRPEKMSFSVAHMSIL